MIKLIKGETIEQLEQHTTNWIDSNITDNRDIEIISSQVLPIATVKNSPLNGSQSVETTFYNWLVFKWVFQPL